MNNLIVNQLPKLFNSKVYLIAFGEPIPPMSYFKFNGRVASNCKGWLIKVKCPFCRHEHLHGWGPPAENNTRVWTRKSHCEQGGEYWIVVNDEVINGN
jgi:hypothetical protein